MAERAILEVAHEDSRKDFRPIHDLLSSELDKLERLSREGKAITGTASGFDDLDTITGGFQPGNLIILAARPCMGKCLAGSALVYDPRTGARRRIDELVASIEAGEDGGRRRHRPRSQAPAVARERRRCATGCSRCSGSRRGSGGRSPRPANHPLFTLRRLARASRPRARRTDCRAPHAAPLRCERPSCGDHEIVLLAALIADGNLTQRTPRFCFGERLRSAPVRSSVRPRRSGCACQSRAVARRASARGAVPDRIR